MVSRRSSRHGLPKGTFTGENRDGGPAVGGNCPGGAKLRIVEDNGVPVVETY